jgi:KaiC/GvpD/RAD55 family RecA-like ATPase
LEIGGPAVNFSTYVALVQEDATKRALIRIASELADGAHNGFAARELIDTGARRLQALAEAAKDSRPDARVGPATMWAGGRALYQRNMRPVAHLVEGVVPATGTVLVTGEDKSGKTTVAVLLTLSYLHGAPFLGRAVPRPGRAIIVSEEDDADELRDRVRALHQGLARAYPDLVAAPDDPAGLALVQDRLVWEARDGWRLDDSVMLADLVTQITTLRGRDPDGPAILVLIDSLQAVRGLSDPGKPEGVALLKVALRQLVAAGAVVLLIAHARQGGERRQAHQPRESGSRGQPRAGR